MKRFFIPKDIFKGRVIDVPRETGYRISRVLRMSPGDRVIFFDGNGREKIVQLKEVGRNGVSVDTIKETLVWNEPSTRIILCQSVTKGKKLDWIFQKSTEIGVSEFFPMMSKRSIPSGKLDGDTSKGVRWGKIITEATEQSGRSFVPTIHAITNFKEVCKTASTKGIGLIAWEKADNYDFKKIEARLDGKSDIYLLVGPEGGFDQEEVEFARNLGLISFSLGKRILRSETAGLVAASVIFYQRNDLDI
jgi:16S rRNA (uracil1498-N3)-methyltransferase